VELDLLTECRHQRSSESAPPELEAHGLTRILARKAADVRRDARRRLRREASCYVSLLAVSIVSLADGFAFKKLAMMGGLGVLIGGIAAALWYGERRLARVPLTGTVRETLAELVSTLHAAGRAYLAAYVALFVVTASIGVSVVWSRYGFAPGFVAALALGVGAVVWSYRSGRAYVDRMFRDDRAELAACLRQLETQ
jgi:hypothetical protein